MNCLSWLCPPSQSKNNQRPLSVLSASYPGKQNQEMQIPFSDKSCKYSELFNILGFLAYEKILPDTLLDTLNSGCGRSR